MLVLCSLSILCSYYWFIGFSTRKFKGDFAFRFVITPLNFRLLLNKLLNVNTSSSVDNWKRKNTSFPPWKGFTKPLLKENKVQFSHFIPQHNGWYQKNWHWNKDMKLYQKRESRKKKNASAFFHFFLNESPFFREPVTIQFIPIQIFEALPIKTL